MLTVTPICPSHRMPLLVSIDTCMQSGSSSYEIDRALLQPPSSPTAAFMPSPHYKTPIPAFLLIGCLQVPMRQVGQLHFAVDSREVPVPARITKGHCSGHETSGFTHHNWRSCKGIQLPPPSCPGFCCGVGGSAPSQRESIPSGDMQESARVACKVDRTLPEIGEGQRGHGDKSLLTFLTRS